MLLLSDNDILIKLGLLGLLSDFIEIIKLDTKDVYITHSTIYSLPNQLKKYTKDVELYQPVLDFVSSFQRIDFIDEQLVSELMSFDNIDSCEAILAAKFITTENSFLATGDKRFLKALSDTEYAPKFFHRVFTFESSLKMLCEKLGYSSVKAKIILASSKLDKPVDGLLRLAFKENSSEEDDLVCLESFSADVEDFIDR